MEHLPVGQHRLDPQHQIAHGPVAEHGGAAGVGGDQPADGRRALRRQGQGKAPADRLGRLVHGGQGNAGLRHDHVVHRVDLADGPEPLGAQQHLALGDLARDQPGVAPLRHDRRPGLGAKAHDGGDLAGAARKQQKGRGPRPAVAPFDQLGSQLAGILAPAVRAEHGLQA